VHVSNAQLQKVLELHVHKVYSAGSRPPSCARGAADELVLSSRGEMIRAVKEKASQMPALRAEAVRELKQRIGRGDYTPDAGEIAEKMFANILQNGR